MKLRRDYYIQNTISGVKLRRQYRAVGHKECAVAVLLAIKPQAMRHSGNARTHVGQMAAVVGDQLGLRVF